LPPLQRKKCSKKQLFLKCAIAASGAAENAFFRNEKLTDFGADFVSIFGGERMLILFQKK